MLFRATLPCMRSRRRPARPLQDAPSGRSGLLCRAARAAAGVLAGALLLFPLAAGAETYRYRGVLHVHSHYSDGSGTFEEIARAANAAGLDFLVATDHDTLQPLRDGHERYWGRSLVLIGVEIGTDAGHMLALGIPGSFPLETRAAQPLIDSVHSAGGFTILAHPFSTRWPWTDWSVRGYTGVEVVNVSSLVDDALHGSVERAVRLWRLAFSDPGRMLWELTVDPVKRDRARWDALLRAGAPVLGIGSVDAHRRLELGSSVYEIPPYRETFESVQTYLITSTPLTGEVQTDRELLYGALRTGSAYIVYPRVGPAPSFSFTAQQGEDVAGMGQTRPFAPGAQLTVAAPGIRRSVIRLLRDGAPVAVVQGERLEWTATEPGTYRAEVYAVNRGGRITSRDVERSLKKGDGRVRPWIFSNPIYLTHP